jgi:hypothetical protein
LPAAASFTTNALRPPASFAWNPPRTGKFDELVEPVT